jgi:hypothetical protein
VSSLVFFVETNRTPNEAMPWLADGVRRLIFSRAPLILNFEWQNFVPTTKACRDKVVVLSLR